MVHDVFGPSAEALPAAAFESGGWQSPGSSAAGSVSLPANTSIVSTYVVSPGASLDTHSRPLQRGQFTYPPAKLPGTCRGVLQRGQSSLMAIYNDNPK